MSIIVNGLNKAYGDKHVLENFSAEIPEGFTCVIGRSGSGKTTLARLLAGLEKPDSGEISGISGNVTYMFQEPRLLPGRSAAENAAAVGNASSKKNLSEAESALKALGFAEEDLKKRPSELSGGMLTRVSLARAAVFFAQSGGNLVILDEPQKGLDEASLRNTAEFIRNRFTPGAAPTGSHVLIITHSSFLCEEFSENPPIVIGEDAPSA